jgi:(1->4)-alpha-D-glucan 1-alpha-D-glucosylmutase
VERQVGAHISAVPLSTYRLQFGPQFGFDDAAAIVEYLDDLGIGAIYASPYLRARSGSAHGYDVVDYNAVNPDVGTPEQHLRFVRAAKRRGIGQIADFVPNHMSIADAGNAWWNDVLQWGAASKYAKYFDIDWDAARDAGRVVLPVLRDDYENTLTSGDIGPAFEPENGRFALAYMDRRFPLAPTSYAPLLRRAAELSARPLAASLEALAAGFEQLTPGPQAHDAFDALCAALNKLVAANAGYEAIDRALEDWRAGNNGTASRRLDELLARQHYRLASWSDSRGKINYRRFFDIDDLAGLRIDDAEVFEHAHRLIFEMLAACLVQGLRIDHVDSLLDPAAYCLKLRARVPYLIVEKVLTGSETVPNDWMVDGTTGYDFLNAVNALFVDPRAEAAFDRIYRKYAAMAEPFSVVAHRAKHDLLETHFAGELSALARCLHAVGIAKGTLADVCWDELRAALAEVVASFPRYRTYVTAEGAGKDDRRVIEATIFAARERCSSIQGSIFDLIQSELTAGTTFAMRFQQFTPALAAKAIEDTALYRYPRLLCLNEVGGDPAQFGTTVAAFHRFHRTAAAKHPHTMLATATHDHKRGADARLRIAALSGMPQRWRHALRAFGTFDGAATANDRYALYQTLLATWPSHWGALPPAGELPAYLSRIERWMRKAMREAKLHTSWERPDLAYEDAAVASLHRLFGPTLQAEFMREFAPLARDVARVGMISSLAQVTLQCTAPGVPDIYQGCELWDLSLVDPDNRHSVDFALRAGMLREMRERLQRGERLELVRELLRTWEDGRVKLFLTWQLLQLRRRFPEIFRQGGYRPLPCFGSQARRLVAFARERLVVVVPRLVNGALRWSDDGTPMLAFPDERIRLPRSFATDYRNVLTGEHVAADEHEAHPHVMARGLFASFPVAVLEPARRAPATGSRRPS